MGQIGRTNYGGNWVANLELLQVRTRKRRRQESLLCLDKYSKRYFHQVKIFAKRKYLDISKIFVKRKYLDILKKKKPI